MKKRLIYEAPDAELILVRFEENFLLSEGGNQRTLDYNGSGGAGNDPASHYGGSFCCLFHDGRRGNLPVDSLSKKRGSH